MQLFDETESAEYEKNDRTKLVLKDENELA